MVRRAGVLAADLGTLEATTMFPAFPVLKSSLVPPDAPDQRLGHDAIHEQPDRFPLLTRFL